MNKTLKATLCCLLGYTIYGFSFLFSKIGFDLAMPNMLLAIRFTVAFFVLSLFVIAGKAKVSVKGKPVKKLLLMGLIQPCLYFVCEAKGIAMTTASFSGVIIGLVPVAGLVLGVIFLKEKCSIFQIVCTVLSVVGVALTTTGGMGEFSATGFILLIVSVLATTTFSILSRSISEEFSAFERTYV
ncbi:MAG: DMT family transporter, partial [Acutalibacteraceae bacterium]|nr:DMT family transporter [Acutalibacteraceae bacterium]